MNEEVKISLESLNSIQEKISALEKLRQETMANLLPHLATFNVGDRIIRSRGRDTERAEVVGRMPIWCKATRRFDIQYEARKIKKDGGLHGLITKFYDAEASQSVYEWKKDHEAYSNGDAPCNSGGIAAASPRFAFGE